MGVIDTGFLNINKYLSSQFPVLGSQ